MNSPAITFAVSYQRLPVLGESINSRPSGDREIGSYKVERIWIGNFDELVDSKGGFQLNVTIVTPGIVIELLIQC